jgi:hypothetical protein
MAVDAGSNVILAEAVSEVKRLSLLLDAGLKDLEGASRRLAETERAYRKAKGLAWVDQLSGAVAFREAQVDAATADLRFARDLAEGLRRSAYESIRSRTAQISAIQSLLSAHREEARFGRTGPEFGP